MTPPDFPFRSGPFRIGDQAQLTDPKAGCTVITLEAGRFHTAKGCDLT